MADGDLGIEQGVDERALANTLLSNKQNVGGSHLQREKRKRKATSASECKARSVMHASKKKSLKWRMLHSKKIKQTTNLLINPLEHGHIMCIHVLRARCILKHRQHIVWILR